MVSKEDIVNSWAFIVKADKKDLGEVKSSLKACGCKDIPSPLSGEGIITYFSNFIRNNGDVEYRKFLSDLEAILDPSINRSFSNITVESFEDNLMSFYLQEIIKKCPEKDLPDIKAALSLTNRERTTMIKEVSMKSRTSDAFRLALPAVLSSITLGSKAILSISAALSAGLGLYLGPLAPLAIGAGVIANKVITSRSEAKRKAFSIIPAVFVLIKIRREYEATIDNANDAVRYVDYLLKCNTSSNGIQSAAIQARKDIEKKGEDDGVVLRVKDIHMLVPFEHEVMQYLSSYAHVPNTSLANTSFPTKRNKYISGIEEYVDDTQSSGLEISEIDRLKQVISETSEENSVLKEKVKYYEEVLHGIRHNLSPDFAESLRPYRQYMYCVSNGLDTSFPVEDVPHALKIGEIIADILNEAGKVEYGSVETVDLVSEIDSIFSKCDFNVIKEEPFPTEAVIKFNARDLHTMVMNNIRTNIDDHAFGSAYEKSRQATDKLVSMALFEDEEFWHLVIQNNGTPFPDNVNPEEVFEYGKCFDTSSRGDRGTGFYYLSKAMSHFGGECGFVPQHDSAYTVKLILKFKK